MDGVTQGFAFLHSMSQKERANLPWILFQQLKITNTVAKLEEIILQLLDYNAKKEQTNVT
jgi:hypothetical protein